METRITSLNASVAGGIAMFEARRQRLGINFG
jgi:23S rRNA (guanosine2251-2'-O)-methyltransferase